MNGGVDESTSYTHNTLKALTNVTRGSRSAQWYYDKHGQPVQIQLGSNNLFQTFDDNGQLTSQKYYLPTTVTFQNTYDKDGNIQTSSDGTNTNTYSYDFANRLSSWNNGTTTVNYQYDKADNLLNPNGKNLTFNTANEINGYTYDGAGNLTQDDQYQYAWNDLGQLTSVQTLSGTLVASYTYYPDGLRKTKTVGSTTYTYYYHQKQLIRVTDNMGKVLWRITWGNGKPMFLTDSTGTTYYYVTNYRGDVIQIVDASGNKEAVYSYAPWGNVLSTNESAAVANQPLGYASYVYDREISQYYLQARYYKPSDGMFLSRDPVAGKPNVPMGQNGYSYTDGNPVILVDSDGEKAIKMKFGDWYDLGQNWFARFDESFLFEQDHVHLYHGGKKESNQVANQDSDGKPHHDKTNKKDPPNWVKKELEKKTGWNWKKKAENYKNMQIKMELMINGPMSDVEFPTFSGISNPFRFRFPIPEW